MIQAVLALVKRFFPQVMLPVTITFGFLGYQLESYLRSPRVLSELELKSVMERRQDRTLKEMDLESK